MVPPRNLDEAIAGFDYFLILTLKSHQYESHYQGKTRTTAIDFL